MAGGAAGRLSEQALSARTGGDDQEGGGAQ
jgi:hypothetical protein